MTDSPDLPSIAVRPSALKPLRARVDRLCDTLGEESRRGDTEGAITPAAWAALRHSALLHAPFPHALGGDDLVSGGRHADLADTLRALGAADLSVGRLVEGHTNAVLLVRRYGTPLQLTRLAEAVATGGLAGVWGAEGAVPLAATRIAGGWRLAGGKSLASGAGFVTNPVVPVGAGAAQVLMLPVLRPGERADLSGWTPSGMRATATGAVDLTGLVVPDDAVLGGPGDFTRQPLFSGGAWRFCAVHLGAVERLVDLLRHHLVSRGRDGDPFQLQRVAEAATAATTARFWVDRAAQLATKNDLPAATVVAFVNLTRGVVERAALDVLELVHRGVGLGGFLHPHPIERIARDLATYLRQPVPDLAMADAARAVLGAERATADLWTLDA